eukprot:TRINITY_DN12498_c0_g1_i1.p1 TRINITY_DN12498_c0_g1~~TRINITY_DN12498_c0_g1_i1.p1  ORF type:complete len:680 (+),score=145.97 TRINITY_DN12498_c0_g1_i1:361-2400(+)
MTSTDSTTTILSDVDKNSSRKPQCFGIVETLEDHLPKKWWETLFDEMYLKTDGDVVEDDSITSEEVDTILNCLSLNEGAVLLDLCCGQGRHLLRLAQIRPDLHLFGIDQSDFLITTAKKRAIVAGSKNVTFCVGDCSNLPYPSTSFDAVVCMGNSFGYFDRESMDAVVLKEVHRVVKASGQFLLDLTDGHYMKTNFSPRSWEWIDSNTFVCRERQLARDGRRLISREVITSTKTGVIRDQFYAERLYTFNELEATLSAQGFESTTQTDVLTGDKSERNQDLGMMAHRMLIKTIKSASSLKSQSRDASSGTDAIVDTSSAPLFVIMGDPTLPSSEKLNQTWQAEDLETVEILRNAVTTVFGEHREVRFLDSHQRLYFELVCASMMEEKPLIFNLCDEGYMNNARLEMHVPALLDLLQLPYTGAGPACLAICYDKALVNATAAKLGVPVPSEITVPAYLDFEKMSQEQIDDLFSQLVFPAFVKPVRGDGSVGITPESIVHTIDDAIKYIDTLRANPNVLSKDVIIQEYLSGEEVSVGIIGNPVLDSQGRYDPASACFMPILKADFSELPSELPPILAYDSKWNPDSPYWTDIKYTPAELKASQQDQLYQHCAVLSDRLELRDFGRFDWRWSAGSKCFKLLEVNPNPGWCHDGKAALMAKMCGMKYEDMLLKIVLAAQARLA